MDSKERNGINGKKKLKNHAFQFRMNMQKICTNVRNGRGGILAAAQRGEVKTDFAQSCEMLQKDKNGVDELSTSHNRAKLYFF